MSTKIIQYKFNNVLCDLMPYFNIEFTNYSYEDVINGEITTRTIYNDILPTKIVFGDTLSSTNRTKSLLQVLEINTSELTNMQGMFCNCTSLSSLNLADWNAANKITINNMLRNCKSLTSVTINNASYDSINKIIDQLPVANNTGNLVITKTDDMTLINTVNLNSKNWNISSIYVMSKEYDASKTDMENLQLALNSGKPYVYLDKDMALEAGTPDNVYFYINKPICFYSNLENVLDIAIRITADDVTLHKLYLTREIRANSSFNDLTIKNCIIEHSSAMGLHLLVRGEGTVCKNITIEDCEFKNNAWHGIAFKGIIPSENKPANGGNGVGQGIFENVIIRNCKSYNNGYVVQPDGSMISDHSYSAGIDVVDSCQKMINCLVENCEAYGNYSNGFHMESVPVKENVRLVNCKASRNGKNPEGPHFGCGFSVIDAGVRLENCISENNAVANYTSLKNQAHSPYKTYTGELINCYDNEILVNWDADVSNQVYNGNNLIYNGDFRYGSMHYGFYYSTYCCWFYEMPNFLKRNGISTPYYESGVHTDYDGNSFIHGKFMTNLFKLNGNKRYRLTVDVDSSKNINNEKLTIGLFKFNYVSDQDTNLNVRDENINKTLLNTTECNSELTTYTFEIDSSVIGSSFTDGYYVLFFRNTIIDSQIPIGDMNPDALDIKIYGIRLEEIEMSSSVIAIYQTTDANSFPVFNDGYIYTVDKVETVSSGLYRVTLSSLNNFTACSFEGNTALRSVEYLKVTNSMNSVYRLFYGCTNLIDVNFTGWNTREVTNVSQMFKNCKKLISMDLSVLNFKNAENFLGLFDGCVGLKSANLVGVINKKTTTIRAVFYNCEALTTIILSDSDMSSVTNIVNTCSGSDLINVVYAENCNDGALTTILEFLPTKTSNNPGIIYITDTDEVSQADINTATSKFWNIIHRKYCVNKMYLQNEKVYNVINNNSNIDKINISIK